MFCEDPFKLCFGCTYIFKSRGARLLPRRPAPQRGARAGARSRAGPVRSAPGRSEPRCLGACSSGPSSPRTRRVLLCPPSVITVPAFAARCGKRPATAHADLSAGDAKADRVPAALDVKCWVLASFAAWPLCRRRPGEGAPAGLSHHRLLLPGPGTAPCGVPLLWPRRSFATGDTLSCVQRCLLPSAKLHPV